LLGLLSLALALACPSAPDFVGAYALLPHWPPLFCLISPEAVLLTDITNHKYFSKWQNVFIRTEFLKEDLALYMRCRINAKNSLPEKPVMSFL
jgi:hypothetical protein